MCCLGLVISILIQIGVLLDLLCDVDTYLSTFTLLEVGHCRWPDSFTQILWILDEELGQRSLSLLLSSHLLAVVAREIFLLL